MWHVFLHLPLMGWAAKRGDNSHTHLGKPLFWSLFVPFCHFFVLWASLVQKEISWPQIPMVTELLWKSLQFNGLNKKWKWKISLVTFLTHYSVTLATISLETVMHVFQVFMDLCSWLKVTHFWIQMFFKWTSWNSITIGTLFLASCNERANNPTRLSI